MAYDRDGAASVTQSPWVVTVIGGNARPEIQVLSPANDFVVEFEETYTIEVNATDLDGDLVRVVVRELDDSRPFGFAFDITAPFGPITIEADGTDGWDEWQEWSPALGTRLLRIIARDSQGVESYPQYLRVHVREDTDPALQTHAERLVTNIVEEASAEPANEQFLGAEESSDEFTNGQLSGLEIAEGVLLTTGLFEVWDAGDLSEETSVFWFTPGDPELETRVVGDVTLDAAVLQFDLTCVHTQLEVRLQFGSEEYIEFVGDQTPEGCKNDAMLITVDGVPVSLVPDCESIIAVNSIHPYIFQWQNVEDCLLADLPPDNEHLYLDDADIAALLQAAMGDPADRVEYDGMTTTLVLHALVEPGDHSIRIVIADVDDPLYDSGLFIQSGSIRTVPPQP